MTGVSAPANTPFRSYSGAINGTVNTGVTWTCPPNAFQTATTGSTGFKAVIGSAGILRRFRIKVGAVVSATTTVTVAIVVNGVSVATATFADTDAVGTEKTGTITTAAVAAEDDIGVAISHDNGANRSLGVAWSFDIENS